MQINILNRTKIAVNGINNNNHFSDSNSTLLKARSSISSFREENVFLTTK